MTEYNPIKKWTDSILERKDSSYPAEYLIRILKGTYPKLNLTQLNMKNKKICDIGCGDGRNLDLLNRCGFDIYGTEISNDIVKKINSKMNNLKINCDIRIGTNENIPFPDSFFDFLISWNSCYYMKNEKASFKSHVKELNRVLTPEGYLILSIPKKSCFIFSQSETIREGYEIIRNDPFNVRNGQILRMFEDEDEIRDNFSEFFTNFIFGSIEDNCFGLNYHWHILVCKK